MKIKEIKLSEFKRFTELRITDIPETAKLVILVGPNGCGKTSIFEGLNHWYKYKGFNKANNKDYYLKKEYEDIPSSGAWYNNRVTIDFYDANLSNQEDIQGSFYFRTAHRNEPDFTTDKLSKQENPKNKIKYETLMGTDCAVSENYQRLVSSTLSGVFDPKNNKKAVESLREELVGKIENSLKSVFDDLELTSIGDPLVNGSFYFTKGNSENFHYKNLSAGEKAAFDLLLDIVIKSEYFSNTVYCIDEPEIHMHTALQSRLLDEMYKLIPENSQLWLSTHSIGMLEKARELELENPNTVCFLDFSDLDFDDSVELSPKRIDSVIWKKFLELTLGDFAKLIAPGRVVFCEGEIHGKVRKSFDAKIYECIFSSKYTNTSFVSVGSCNEVIDGNNTTIKIISGLLNNTNVIRLIDRDERSDNEVLDLISNGITVLKRRNIECYLLDDEIITKLCRKNNADEEKIKACLTAKSQAIADSVQRGNPEDDMKSASGEIYDRLKRILKLSHCGNDKDAFLRDTMAPLITEDTKVYRELESEIFR